MQRFDRYLLTQLLAVFGFFALVLVLVYWVNRAVALFDHLIGDGQTALVFLEFSVLTLPNVIRVVLPIAAFAAAVFVANRLTQDSEMVVMQATGFSSFRLARPVLIFGLFVAAGLLAFTISLDDVVITSFTTGPGSTTLPLLIWSKVKLGVTPDINALATLMVVTVGLGVIIAGIILNRAEARRLADERMAYRSND